MLSTNHSWDRSGIETQTDFVAITDNSQATGSHRYQIYTGEPVGGTL